MAIILNTTIRPPLVCVCVCVREPVFLGARVLVGGDSSRLSFGKKEGFRFENGFLKIIRVASFFY